MAGISISFAADVRGFLKGTGDASKALEDVSDSLDDLVSDADKADEVGDALADAVREGAKLAGNDLDRLATVMEGVADGIRQEADRAGEEIGTEIKAGADKAETAGENLEKKFRDVFDTVEKKAKDAGDTVGRETKRGFDQADTAAGNLKDEAKENFAEMASSFDGSMTSIADAAQGTLGGLALSGGPIGLAAAAIGAVAGGFYTQWKQSSEESAKRVSEMYDDMLESGNNFLSESYIQEQAWQVLKGESDLINKQNLAAVADWSMRKDAEVALAYAGNIDMMNLVTQSLIDKRGEFQKQLEDEDFANDSAARSAIAYIDQMIGGLDRRREEIENTTSALTEQREVIDYWGTTAIESAEEARSRFDGVGRSIKDLPDRKTTTFTGVASTRQAERDLDNVATPRTASVYADLGPARATVRSWQPVVTATLRVGIPKAV